MCVCAYTVHYLVLCYVMLFFGCVHGMRKFPGQGLNSCRCSDNAGSSTHGATQEPLSLRTVKDHGRKLPLNLLVWLRPMASHTAATPALLTALSFSLCHWP